MGSVVAPGCELDNADYDLAPTFFAAEPIEDQLEIRLQRGSDFEGKSDGIFILVRDAPAVRNAQLGRALPLTRDVDALVRMSLYLNDSCPPDRGVVPVNYEAQAGSITFQSIYAPTVDEDDVEISATFDAELVDPSQPDERNARLSGDFRFLYTRGRPAQPFP